MSASIQGLKSIGYDTNRPSCQIHENAYQTKLLRDLEKAWLDYHKFKFTARRMLAGNLTMKILKEMKSRPRQFEVRQPHELKLASSLSTVKKDAYEDDGEGKPLKKTTTELDPVYGHNALLERIEALLNMLSYTTIDDPTWFPYQSAMKLQDTFRELMSTR